LIAQFYDRACVLDFDPEVPSRFPIPYDVDLCIGDAAEVFASLLHEFDATAVALNSMLIEAEHSASGVRRDIETVIHRPAPPREPMFIVMHDSGNAECHRGINNAGWVSCPYVRHVELDSVPGLTIEHAIGDDRSEVWGGLALA
jgi:hypothetical protein